MKKIQALKVTLALLAAGMSMLAPVKLVHAQQYYTRYIYANSVCRYPIRMMVYHKDSENNYHPHGWYNFRPYEESRLKAHNVVLRQVVGYDLYFYAETDNRYNVPAMSWARGDAAVNFEGIYYNLTRANLFVNTKGELEFKLSCA